MNNFDFFTISASSSRITSLMKLPNVKRKDIEHRVYYGNGKFPTHFYRVTLGYYDVMEFGHFGARERANKDVEALLATKPEDVTMITQFWPRD